MEKQFRLTCERPLFAYDDNLHLRFRITVHINQNAYWRYQLKEVLINPHLRSEKVDTQLH